MSTKVYHISTEAIAQYGFFGFRDLSVIMRCWEGGQYRHVATVNSDDLELVFELTNHIHDSWTMNGKVQVFNGEDHRSTMVGDICVNEQTGEKYVCSSIGWEKVYFVG